MVGSVFDSEVVGSVFGSEVVNSIFGSEVVGSISDSYVVGSIFGSEVATSGLGSFVVDSIFDSEVVAFGSEVVGSIFGSEVVAFGSEVVGSGFCSYVVGSLVVLIISLVSTFSLVVSKILFFEVVSSSISSLSVVGSFIFVDNSLISGLEVEYSVVPIFTWVESIFKVVGSVVSIFDWVVGTISKLEVSFFSQVVSCTLFSVVFISSLEVLSKLEVVGWFSVGVVVGISVVSLVKEVVGIFSVIIEVLGIILLVFVIDPVVSLIIDVEISVKEVVFIFNSGIFVDSNLFVVGTSFSLVDIDWVELFELIIVLSLSKVVVSNKGFVVGIFINVVSIFEVLNAEDITFSSNKVLPSWVVSWAIKVVGSLFIELLISVKPSVSFGL